MLQICDDLLEELPEFQAHLEYEFKNNKSEFFEALQTKAVPLKELIKELFSPTNPYNQDSTEMLVTITTIGTQALIDELLDEKKSAYKYLSILGSELSHEYCPNDVKRAMLGQMASNDLAKSSFAGVTAQVQCYRLIGMSNAAAVSNVARNRLLNRDGTKKQINHATTSTKKKINYTKRGLYHGLPKGLQITLLMMCMEDAPATRKQNNDDLNRSHEWRAQKDKVAEEKGL